MSRRVSIIIVTWNRVDLLRRYLPSVVATDYDNLEIIVADNNSTDGSADWVRSNYPKVRVIEYPDNYAFCRGNNEAIRTAEGDFIVLLNNDVEVPKTWLRPLVDFLDDHPRAGAVQPKLLQMADRNSFEYSGAAGGFLDRFGYPFARGRLFFTLEQDSGQYDVPAPVFWASGAALVLRRSALERAGFLDENFVLHMEEIDLCWRLQRSGYSVWSFPKSVVYHLGGGSLPPTNPKKTYYNFRNGLLLLYKNLPRPEWRKVFPARAALDFVAALRLLLSGKPGEARAIAKAYRDAHKMKGLYRAQRPGPEQATVLPGYRGSVVVDYFLLGRRTFQDLPSDKFISVAEP